MVKVALNGTYLGGKIPTALQNEVYTFWKTYYGMETCVMINQLVN